jgi:formamidopyrimidine-DNA glycosylase
VKIIQNGLLLIKESLTIPELPEVETIVRDLKEIEGYKVIFIKTFEKIDSIRKTPIYDIAGLIVDKVERHGKYIIIKFEKSAFIIHLGMSGKVIIDDGDALIPKHCHLLFQLDNHQQVRFVDHRHFGNLWHLSYKDALQYVQSKVGPEPFNINPVSFQIRIRQPQFMNKPIKLVLLNQKLIAGLGNIYASEACYDAYIHPKTLVADLTDGQLEQLLYSSRKVLEKGIKNNGTSFMDYRDAKNQQGNNQHYLSAYKQKICKRCQSEMTKEKIENRMTYWCDNCLSPVKTVKQLD